MSALSGFNGITLLVLVAAIILIAFIPYFMEKDQEAYHMQHTAASGCPECQDKP